MPRYRKGRTRGAGGPRTDGREALAVRAQASSWAEAPEHRQEDHKLPRAYRRAKSKDENNRAAAVGEEQLRATTSCGREISQTMPSSSSCRALRGAHDRACT